MHFLRRPRRDRAQNNGGLSPRRRGDVGRLAVQGGGDEEGEGDSFLRLAGDAEVVDGDDGELAGGLYGVSLGAAFFGESMFYRQRDASKVALVHLVARLRERKFELLDSQATTTHLRRFGCVEIPAREYLRRLRSAITKERSFD